MKKILFTLILVFSTVIYSQEKNQPGNNDLFSPVNIKKFADYLFCQKDYLRAADEYERYLKSIPDDTIEFKIALSYSAMCNFSEAEKRLGTIKNTSNFFVPAQMLSLKTIFQEGDIARFRNAYIAKDSDLSIPKDSGIALLYNFSSLLTEASIHNEDDFVENFPYQERSRIKYFYEWKENPPEKSPLKAALFSAIIPGAGKFYAEEYSDGIWAFIATLGTAYLAYDNFNARHYTRGWIFSALAAGFYAGNIYGSASAVQIYNTRIRFDFVNEVKTFLEDKNYFLKVFDFCK
ncbi:MAG: hypothetical protein P4L45_04520 [Ignavibacteriaceae bacterium]|nr:hypothetical protein [Ignavibacteriaceae bacterium]